MGLSVRDWMVIVGVLLVVAVLLDGYRRMRQEWRSQIRTSLSKAGSDKDGFDTNSELPNGGARVVARSERRPARVEPRISYAVDPLHGKATRAGRRGNSVSHPESDYHPDSDYADDVDDEVRQGRHDILLDAADTPPLDRDIDAMDDGDLSEAQVPDYRGGADTSPPDRTAVEPAPAAAFDASEPIYADDFAPAGPLSDADAEWPAADSGTDEDRFGAAGDSATVFAEPEVPPARSARLAAEPEPAVEDAASTFESPDEAPSLGPADEVVVINVLAKDRPFSGPELLQILLTCDLRFGKMNIFHRYEQAGGKGPLQFSVANIVEPGVFNLDRIDDFTTRGVCFFLTLPGPQEPLVAFNYMVETAQCLVRNLNGELRDEAHSVMTAQTLEHCRARIREFERRQLTRPPR